jgi:hypothetical protein
MSNAERYRAFTHQEFDAGLLWLRNQGLEALSKRLWIEGDYVKGDLRGVPPIVRQMLREQFEAMLLMTDEQYQDYRGRDVEGRVRLVDEVLTEAGR